MMMEGKIKHCVVKVRRDLALMKRNAHHVIDGDFSREVTP